MNTQHAARRLGLIAILALCGCASAPKSATTANLIRAASDDIASAEDARAADFAQAEMRSAHDKLNAARALARQAGGDPKSADAAKVGWLAEEASADAALAQAKALDVRNQSAVRGLQRAPAVAPGTGGS